MGNEQAQAPKPKALNPTELQTYLMVTQVKLNQGRNKKIALIKKKQDEIIKHLNDNNLDIAKAKMESLMREEDYITVYDILGPLCEILKEKVTYIMTSKECPADLRASLDTLIYSSTRLEIEELHFIREFIKHKYTNIYVDKANSNIDKLVNINVVDKLTVKPYPEAELIFRLKGICERENIQFSFPQLANPLIIDPNINNNPVIPNMNNFNMNTNQNNMGGFPSAYGQQQNFNANTGNVIPPYMPNNNQMPNNTFPFPQQQQQQQQQNMNYNNPQFPQGQYPMYNANSNMSPNMNPNLFQQKAFDNPNVNPYESSGLNFNNIPNNFSNTANQNFNQASNMQGNANFPPTNYPNNQIIPPMNTINNSGVSSENSSNNGFPSMPNANNTFPMQKGGVSPMMSEGFPPMMGNDQQNNTFPQGKMDNSANNVNFPPMANVSPGYNNPSQTFPNINSPNFANLNDLEFPSTDGFPKKKN